MNWQQSPQSDSSEWVPPSTPQQQPLGSPGQWDATGGSAPPRRNTGLVVALVGGGAVLLVLVVVVGFLVAKGGGRFGGPAQGVPGAFNPPVGSDGKVEDADWPDACAALTDQEASRVVPAGNTIVGKQGRTVPEGIGGKSPRPTSCTWSVTKPGQIRSSTINVYLVGVGDPAEVKKEFDRSHASQKRTRLLSGYKDFGGSLGAEHCYGFDDLALHCRDRKVAFAVAGANLDPEVSTIEQARQIWHDQVLVKVVRMLAEKTG